MAHTFVVLGAAELGGEDARSGAGTENAQVEYENQTVDDGDTAHGYGAHLAYHNIVQQIDKIGDTVLNHDGNGNPEDPFVKGPVTDVM
jgi:lipopolysaccharide export system protein LptA